MFRCDVNSSWLSDIHLVGTSLRADSERQQNNEQHKKQVKLVRLDNALSCNQSARVCLPGTRLRSAD